MTTAGDIIGLALRRSGIVGSGQTPSARDANDSLTILQQMIAQWQRKRWLIYHLADFSIAATGAESYTIGTGGNFNTNRPDRLEAGNFVRLVNPPASQQTDYPLTLIEARENYNQITLKQMQSWPQYIFYDAAFPLGIIRVWPIPSSQYEIHILVKGILQTFPTLVTVFAMPDEYLEAITLNLIRRLRSSYQLPPDDENNRMADAALNTIKNANAQIPALQVPNELVRGSRYNFYSDQMY